jgi:hypothetical protein
MVLWTVSSTLIIQSEMFSRALAPKRFVVCPRSSHVNIDLADEGIFSGAIKQFLAQLN